MFLWNEETLFKFFGRWAKLLDFWCEIFVKFLKTAAYGCSGTFWCFFWREEYLFDQFRSLSENNRHSAKNLAFGIVAKSEFHVSSAKLWEKMTKVFITIIISFGTLSEFFSDFVKKNSQVCRDSNQVYRAKNVKNTLAKLVFRFSWTLTRKTCSFTGIFLAVLSKLLYTSPEEPL